MDYYEQIPSKKVQYKNIVYRSHLEARWAVFWDQLDIKHEYEPKSFLLESGVYVPDFYLSDFHVWFEIKPLIPDDDALKRIAELSRYTHENTFIMWGFPRITPFIKTLSMTYLETMKLHYCITGFCGNISLGEWPGGVFEFVTLGQISTLPVHLHQNKEYLSNKDIPVWEECWGRAEELIELDKQYHKNRYKSDHPRWKYGFSSDDYRFQWTEWGGKITLDAIEMAFSMSNGFRSERLKRAFKIASQYNFWQGEDISI